MICYEGRQTASDIASQVADARKQLKERLAGKEGSDSLDQELAQLESGQRSRRNTASEQILTPAGVGSSFAGLFGILHETEMPVTTQTLAGVQQAKEQLKNLMANWEGLKNKLSALGLK